MDERECLYRLGIDTTQAIVSAWEGQIRHNLLWQACTEAVTAGDNARLEPWRQALTTAQNVLSKRFGPHHRLAARTLLACAQLAGTAQAVQEQYKLPGETLVAVLHDAVAALGTACNCDVDHEALGTAGPAGGALTPPQAVDRVFTFLAVRGVLAAVPGWLSWAWDVTRTLLGAPRPGVYVEIPVVGTEGAQGFLATLVLEVLEPGCGEVFHAPDEVFHTRTDEAFATAMQDAWRGACRLTQEQGAPWHTRDGRWRLRRAGSPAAEANDRSASGAAARGWWYALMGHVPDAKLIVLAQVDPADITQLIGVEGVEAKTDAIAREGTFDTLVVTTVANEREATTALQEVGQAARDLDVVLLPSATLPHLVAQRAQPRVTLKLEPLPAPTALPPGSHLTLPRNHLFVGRAAALQDLAAAFNAGKRVAITGIGGVGKTQLANEFVQRYGKDFRGGVFWLHCAKADAGLEEQIVKCGQAGALRLRADFHTLPRDAQVQLVRDAWRSPRPRLLVFDDCEEDDLTWLPDEATSGCRVLLTSRRMEWPATLGGLHTLQLGELSRAESVALLWEYRRDLAADDADLAAIAAELGDLPLALHLAGSALGVFRHDPQFGKPVNFLADLRAKPLLELEHLVLMGEAVSPSPTNHVLSVATTFDWTYRRLRPDHPVDDKALALLARAAYFAAGEPIPRELLRATLHLVESDREAQCQATLGLVRLHRLGLLEPAADGALRLHRLLAMFVRMRNSEPQAQRAVEEALLREAHRVNHAGDPRPLRAWQGHLRAVTDAAQAREDERAADLCYELGGHLGQLGAHREARSYCQRAQAIYEQVLGADHAKVAVSLTSLAELARALGAYAQAAADGERALAIHEKTGDPLAVATSLNTLAGIYRSHKKYTEAEAYWHQALQIRKAQCGEQHPDVAAVLNHLGELYRDQEKYVEAERCYSQALEIRRTTLPPEHPDIAQSLNNWAGLYYEQGADTHAEPLLFQALDILKRTLGEEHPEVASILNNLALIAYAQGRHSDAEKYGLEAWKILKQPSRGPQHPDTQAVRQTLKRILEG